MMTEIFNKCYLSLRVGIKLNVYKEEKTNAVRLTDLELEFCYLFVMSTWPSYLNS